MIKILANDGLGASGSKMIVDAGCILVTDRVEQNKLVEEINKNAYDAIIVRSETHITKEIIDACPSIKLVARAGAGMEHIAVSHAIEKGIRVFSTPRETAPAVAELVFAHLFSISRKLFDSNRKMPTCISFKDLKKKYGEGIEIAGKTMGIVGFGRIGQEVAKRALGLGMRVRASDPYVTEANLKLDICGTNGVDVTVRTVIREVVLRESDYISLHLPVPDDNLPVITENEFNKMKDGVILINASKAELINEDHLIAALKSGKVSHAGIDVFCNEPNPRKDLISLENVSVTPHIGGATKEAQERISIALANEIIDFFKL
jgi:D-3-phosphoglycerate dehydrogenase / 2-oxoglutarate reductase